MQYLGAGVATGVRQAAGRVDDLVVDERDPVVGAPEDPHPVVLAVAARRVGSVAVERAGGHGDARVAGRVRHQELAPDVLATKEMAFGALAVRLGRRALRTLP